MLNNWGCISLVTHNKLVNGKMVMVGTSVAVVVGVLVLNMGDRNVTNLLSVILRFFLYHLLLLHLHLGWH